MFDQFAGMGILGAPTQGGAPPSVAGNVTTENREVVANGMKADTHIVHTAVGVIVASIIILAFGRGYLRNARIS